MVKNIFRVLISNLIVVIIGFINGLIFPKLLSIDDYAKYQTYLLCLSYIGILSLGFPSGLFVKYGGTSYESIDKEQYKSEIKFVIGTQCIFTIDLIIIAWLLNSNILFYSALSIIPINVVGTYKALYQAWGQFKKFSFVNSFISIVTCLLMIFLWIVNNDSDYKIAIFPYIIVNGVCCSTMIYIFMKDTRKVKASNILSKENYSILNIGFLLMIGAAASIVLSSLDRFFIKYLFGSYEFAMYSFALSMQSMMGIFITAVSQPLYSKMASGNGNINMYNKLKKMLLMFGSFSGCAYFACSIIIKVFIPKYIDSLRIISILFAIFPAISVINCIFVNLYKVTRKIKEYLLTLALMIIICFFLILIFVNLSRNYLAIAVATTITYYIWLWYSSRHFEGLKLSKKDIIYHVGFFTIFFITTMFLSDVLGLIVYFISICGWIFIIYNDISKEVYNICLSMVKTNFQRIKLRRINK